MGGLAHQHRAARAGRGDGKRAQGEDEGGAGERDRAEQVLRPFGEAPHQLIRSARAGRLEHAARVDPDEVGPPAAGRHERERAPVVVELDQFA